jgi:hypothetical protein
MEPTQTPAKSNGALIGLIIVIVILVIGGVYLWQKNMADRAAEQNGVPSDINTLDADVQNMDLDSVDSGM